MKYTIDNFKNDFNNEYICIDNTGEDYLTVNKVYINLIELPKNHVINNPLYLKDDSGSCRIYNRNIFMNKQDFRDKQLSQILK